MELLENKIGTRELSQRDDKPKGTVDENNNIRRFTECDIKRITNNYSTMIGKGGFGKVYRGVLDDNHGEVAVKKYNDENLIEEFMEEVNIHSKINHKNVVKLIGYCIGENTLTMVTEFIVNGNLDNTLHNSDIPISLVTRLGIAIGCAEALSYMHSMHLSSDNLVCHGDIKPANILLDANLITKVSDFGLLRLLARGVTRHTRNVIGSRDYMDPSYFLEGRLTRKNDVYSFGAVLLELIARKRVRHGNINLISTFREAYAKGRGLSQLCDAQIPTENNTRILQEMGKLAIECLALNINKRPHINDVAERLRMLWKALRGEGNIGTGGFKRTQSKSHTRDGQGTDSASVNYSRLHLLGISKRNNDNSDTVRNFGKIRIFSMEELSEVTENYSCLLSIGWPYEVYKGTLEDNTMVAVKISREDYDVQKRVFCAAAMIHSQIVHKNIIKLLGCCVDVIPVQVYEYAGKRNLSDVLHGGYDFPVELRLMIAVKIAQALAYLQSPAVGVILHGGVTPSNIYLDDNLVPKIGGFLDSRRLTEDENYANFVLNDMAYIDPNFYLKGILSEKTDVYSFGVVLFELISRKKEVYQEGDNRLIPKFIRAYETYESGTKMFDKTITDKEDIAVLEKIGRLALQCINCNPHQRPTMNNVAGILKTLAVWFVS
uniref:Protein kinase domain-containing protein n=1 Tax=Leersia perrieri TaxID=77586 RepID=A0A0D9XT66_9ORYZ